MGTINYSSLPNDFTGPRVSIFPLILPYECGQAFKFVGDVRIDFKEQHPESGE